METEDFYEAGLRIDAVLFRRRNDGNAVYTGNLRDIGVYYRVSGSGIQFILLLIQISGSVGNTLPCFL